MPEIAPWEDPNLPAPFATIEREMEGQANRFGTRRRFELWTWDNRIVWRDESRHKLWWATLEQFEEPTNIEWEIALTQEQFGRAKTHSYQWRGEGHQLGLPPEVHFQMAKNSTHDFLVIADERGSGIWRAVNESQWQSFFADKGAQDRASIANFNSGNPSIWCPDYSFPEPHKSLFKATLPTLFSRLPISLREVLTEAENSAFLTIIRALAVWLEFKHSPEEMGTLHQQFQERLPIHPNLLPKILAHFGLPITSEFISIDWLPKGRTLHYQIEVDGMLWRVDNEIPKSPSMHEILEAQLQLRDALKPILTSTEIEEILAP